MWSFGSIGRRARWLGVIACSCCASADDTGRTRCGRGRGARGADRFTYHRSVANTSYPRREVEGYVHTQLSKELDQPFTAVFLSLQTGGRHEFDAVSADHSVVASVKSASGLTSGGRGKQTTVIPSAAAPAVFFTKISKKAGVVRRRRVSASSCWRSPSRAQEPSLLREYCSGLGSGFPVHRARRRKPNN